MRPVLPAGTSKAFAGDEVLMRDRPHGIAAAAKPNGEHRRFRITVNYNVTEIPHLHALTLRALDV
jgi:hypothetical protein